MKCDIFFSNFDKDKINKYGWDGEEGKLYLKLTGPLDEDQRSINALNESLEKGKFKFIGSLELEKPEYAYGVLQNAYESHPLNNRSMMIGDIVICDKKVGKIVEPTGWSDLSQDQIKKFQDFI